MSKEKQIIERLRDLSQDMPADSAWIAKDRTKLSAFCAATAQTALPPKSGPLSSSANGSSLPAAKILLISTLAIVSAGTGILFFLSSGSSKSVPVPEAENANQPVNNEYSSTKNPDAKDVPEPDDIPGDIAADSAPEPETNKGVQVLGEEKEFEKDKNNSGLHIGQEYEDPSSVIINKKK